MNYIDSDPWHQGVGGVGGVGGLTNMDSPVDNMGNLLCNTTAGRTENYCWREGAVFGLTPFSLVFLCVWVVPFILAVVRVARVEEVVWQTEEDEEKSGGLAVTRVLGNHEGLLSKWGLTLLSLLWFIVPAWRYLSTPFYQTDVWHLLLGCAIAAAFPLSWHLALVAVPFGEDRSQ